ncbi:MAG: chorismate synthase [Desulfobacteraceae bacterium]|nr:chorismate synthase [Desulfobacteraceae bacterium]
MTGSSFGKVFNITTFGESHGKAIGVTIQGCPPGLTLTEDIIQKELDKRKPGQGILSTKRKEPDKAIILSGVFEGLTTGTPIMIMIENKDADSKAYDKNSTLFRPGHGDITYFAKYGIRDYKGGGRSSARETASRVAAGAVALSILEKHNISIQTNTIELGGIKASNTSLESKESNYLQCPDLQALQQMEKKIEQVKQEGDSLGGVVEVRVLNAPAGLGEPVFDKLDADIAKALMSIGAVKAVEIGAGCQASKLKGSENNDQITKDGFITNNSGGILAGISNGDDIVAKVSIKPIPSIKIPLKTIDEQGNEKEISTHGRHDISAIPRINHVCKAMMAITITDHLLRQEQNH